MKCGLMRVLTWNINSLRIRMDLLADVVNTLQPDVVCLQETKVPDPLFPLDQVKAMGFDHVAYKGMKSYNGVAILSKYPMENIQSPLRCDRDDCRHLMATIAGIEIHNLYIPAGGDIPDPDLNVKFEHKLNFIKEITQWFSQERHPTTPMVLVGDLNIAPLETDVWSHKQLLSVVSHTPIEVELLTCLQNSIDWVDAVRHFVPVDERLYSWWSYRSPDWSVNDRGRRLDHIWVTPQLKDALRSTLTAKECRHWLRPSDHVPVLVEIAL
jgi:exodeoxyribonuclease III